jgi:hypothetical protein
MNKRFKCKPCDKNNLKYCGLHIKWTETNEIEVSSDDYEKNIHELIVHPKRERDWNEYLTEEEEREFRKMLGKLMWVAKITRADVTYEVAAVSKAYDDAYELCQNYEMKDIKNHKKNLVEHKPRENKKIEKGNETNEHMPGFDEIKCESENVNKINIHKVKKKNTGENFKTHLKVKNMVYLNKVIRKIKQRPDMKVYFSDVTKGKGIDDLRLVVYCDAALMNADKHKSQIGYVACLMSKTEQYKIPDFEYIDPISIRKKKPTHAYPYVEACPISWRSMQSPRVAQSSFAAELQALFLGTDVTCVFRTLLSELLYGTPLYRMQTEIRNDNLSIVKSVQSLANVKTQEKRLNTLITSIKDLIDDQEISKVTYVPTDINVSDEMTKGTGGNNVYHLMTFNIIQVARQEAIWKRHAQASTQKQYLIDTRHFSELKH